MAITNSREILKEFNLALRHFRNAIKMAKKNLIVGELNFGGIAAPKVRKPRKVKNVTKDLPDLDKKGYMSERKNPTEDKAEK